MNFMFARTYLHKFFALWIQITFQLKLNRLFVFMHIFCNCSAPPKNSHVKCVRNRKSFVTLNFFRVPDFRLQCIYSWLCYSRLNKAKKKCWIMLFFLFLSDYLGAKIAKIIWKFTHYRYYSNHIACSGLHKFMCQSGQ